MMLSTSPSSRLVLGLFAISLLLPFCKTASDKREKALSHQDSLELYFSGLHDSIDAYWAEMMADDDEKHFHIRRLLEEISYTRSFDPQRVDSLLSLEEMVKSARYDQLSMASSEKIDWYDAHCQHLITAVIGLAEANSEYENRPLMKELVLDIREAEHRVLFHRINYDDLIFQYNAFIETHPDQVEAFRKRYTIQKMPVFTLSE